MTTAEMPSDSPVIHTQSLVFRYPGRKASDAPTELAFPDIELKSGESLFLRGPSGSGKSTLLGLLAGMNLPAKGETRILGTNLNHLNQSQRDQLRADCMGVIFQQFNLLPYLTVFENVLLPCRLSKHRGGSADSARDEASRHLQALNIDEPLWNRKATELSVGQQQRVAAARALMGGPPVILADEPTSALDTSNRDRFIENLLAHATETRSAVVLVSHDPALADRFDHQIALEPRT